MKKTIAIIGGGAAGMAIASFIDTSKYEVTLYEQNKTLGRKFLVAGKGGFNLTHSIEHEEFKKKYTPSGFLDQALDSFTNLDFQAWMEKIGIPTYTGSSGRIFPTKGLKPIQVLDAILQHITKNQVKMRTEVKWEGEMSADIVVYALGGASWEVTGSDGLWSSHFANVVPFTAANCAFEVSWPKVFIEQNEGKPLKNISLEFNGVTEKGELVISKFGLEGNAIYAHSEAIQESLKSGPTKVNIDLKTHLSQQDILKRLQFSKEKTVSNSLKRDIKLDKTSIRLLQSMLSKEEYLNPDQLTNKIKSFPVKLLSPAPISEAISTMGGIAIDELDEKFQLKKKAKHYCIGEMVDWNAPTGGYLLQACFSMGYYLAMKLNE